MAAQLAQHRMTVYLFWWYPVRISIGFPLILAEILRGFPQCVLVDTGIVSSNVQQPSTSRSSPTHYSCPFLHLIHCCVTPVVRCGTLSAETSRHSKQEALRLQCTFHTVLAKYLGYGLDDRGSLPVGVEFFLFATAVPRPTRAHPISYPMGNRVSFPGSKATGP
jgi:hypothetical protein